MESTLSTNGAVGSRMPMIEGNSKVTGNLKYVADIQMAGMLHARLVTSQHAHARILNIDTTEAAKLPGIVAILTAADLPDILPTTRQRLLLARERVIFAGQPVALVLAESANVAEDAIEQIFVEYEPLPAAHGADVGGEEEDAPQLSNVAKSLKFERGDVAAGFAEADIILERTFTTPMVHQAPLETHGCAIMIDPMLQEVTVWTPTHCQRLRSAVSVPQWGVGLVARAYSTSHLLHWRSRK